MKHSRERWARKPTMSPAPREMARGAYVEPGPFSLAKTKVRLRMARSNGPTIAPGTVQPTRGFIL